MDEEYYQWVHYAQPDNAPDDEDEAEQGLLRAAKHALNYISNTESELGITLASGDSLRRAIAIAESANCKKAQA